MIEERSGATRTIAHFPPAVRWRMLVLLLPTAVAAVGSAFLRCKTMAEGADLGT